MNFPCIEPSMEFKAQTLRIFGFNTNYLDFMHVCRLMATLFFQNVNVKMLKNINKNICIDKTASAKSMLHSCLNYSIPMKKIYQ